MDKMAPAGTVRAHGMSRLRHSDYARLLDFIASLQEPVSAADFGAHVVAAASRLRPEAVIAFDQIGLVSGQYLFDHNVPMGEEETTPYFQRLREVFQQNPIYSYLQNGGRGPVVDIAALTTRREFHRSEFYQDIFRPFGLEHQLNVLVPRPGWITTLTINSPQAFPEEVSTLFTLASRHVAAAHRQAQLLSLLEAAAPSVLPAARAEISQAEPSAVGLTPREYEVFSWLAEGKRNAEIAIILGCAPRTVEKHVENILRKLGVENRAAAMRAARGARTGSERPT